MWFYNREADAIETLTCLSTGAQVFRLGEGDHSELWWRATADHIDFAPSRSD